jgi:phosphoribosylcarboxyaminoimidazole (NCAIR) mutase
MVNPARVGVIMRSGLDLRVLRGADRPGMVASLTDLPVTGVPVVATLLNGNDSLLSIVQMPAGVPVVTVGGE